MAKQPNREEWNKIVEGMVQSLRPAKSWLSDYAEEKKKNAWSEQVNIERASHYLELATLEMYSLQWHVDDEDKLRSRRAMDIE